MKVLGRKGPAKAQGYLDYPHRASVKSNNLDGAKTAFSLLGKNAPANAISDPKKPLVVIGKALQSEGLAVAQQALSNMRGANKGAGNTGTSVPIKLSPVPNPADASGNNVYVYV